MHQSTKHSSSRPAVDGPGDSQQPNATRTACVCMDAQLLPYKPCFILACSAEFRQVKELGKGGFSIVFRGTHRIDGCEYALKRTKSPVSDNKERNAWLQVSLRLAQQQQELQLYKSASHLTPQATSEVVLQRQWQQ